jgi:hypothetical protein
VELGALRRIKRRPQRRLQKLDNNLVHGGAPPLGLLLEQSVD